MRFVCKASDTSQIFFDNRSIDHAFHSEPWTPIEGTEYIALRSMVSAGDQAIKSISDSIRWMAWTQGSLDGLGTGRAYSSVVGLDISSQCDNMIAVKDSVNGCGNRTVRAVVQTPLPECSGIRGGYRDGEYKL